MAKKANIPVVFFVLGVFLVCSFALLTFFISDFKFSNSFVGIGVLESVNYDLEEYTFYKNQEVPLGKIDNSLGILEDNDGRYIYKEKIHRGKVIFSIKTLVD